MSTITRSRSMQVLSKLIVIALCVLCLQALCGCASKSGEEGVVDLAIKYAKTRAELDMTVASVVRETPDAELEVLLLGVEDAPNGIREIKVEPVVISDTMASWTEDEWEENRVDLFFNLAAHFNVICKQAYLYSDVPEDYAITCPDYMVVYDSQRSTGFIVASSGVYRMTDDPENPIGEPIVED